MIQDLARAVSGPETKDEISQKMKQLQQYRQNWIAESKELTITEILRMYPRFLDSDGLVSTKMLMAMVHL